MIFLSFIEQMRDLSSRFFWEPSLDGGRQGHSLSSGGGQQLCVNGLFSPSFHSQRYLVTNLCASSSSNVR
jgi:hypothetical protein